MLEANEKLSKKLEAIETKINGGSAPTETKPSDKSIPMNWDADGSGWDNVQSFFRGRQGVPKARKFIKFLNMLTVLEEPYY